MDKTGEVVNRQIRSMCSEVFEIGLFRPESGKDASQPEMFLRTWDKESLFRSLSWLRFQNMNGRNIFIRPKGEHQLSLIDDLKPDGISALKTAGFNPALVVQTSPGNFQVWLNHGMALSKDLSTAVARTLAEKSGGDTGAADWRHFGRLSGFSNRKEKYRQADGLFPFVRLMEANQAVYPKATEFVAEVRERLERDRATAEERRQKLDHSASRSNMRLKTIDDFRNNPMYSGDGNRVELAFAVYAASHGMPQSEIRSVIASRDLGHKGNQRRQEEYIERTIQKAAESATKPGRFR